MKRYWLFAYDAYYPSGGMRDLEATYDTWEECEAAVAVAVAKKCDNIDVFDSQTGVLMEHDWGKGVLVEDRRIEIV